MRRIGLLIFDDVDVMDVTGPYEVFLTANRLAQRRGEPIPFDVCVVSTDGRPVTAYGGLGLVPFASSQDVERLDVLVVPGGIDVPAITNRADLIAGVRRLSERCEVVSSVCTGAFLLERAGLLSGGVSATTHHEDVPELARRLGDARVHGGCRWVDSGRVVTGGGLSSGIAMALHLVDRFLGRDRASAVAQQIEYDWDPYSGHERSNRRSEEPPRG